MSFAVQASGRWSARPGKAVGRNSSTFHHCKKKISLRAKTNGDGKGEGSGFNPKAAFSSFLEQMDSHVDVNPRSSSSSTNGSRFPKVTTKEDQLRKQESALLDVVTNENVFKLGAASAMTLILFIAIAAAPSDM